MGSKYLLKLTLLFVIYFATGRLGLSLDAVSGFAALVWAPTGIALAAMLILGFRYWPGIALGAVLVNMAAGAPLLVALGIGCGNTLEALAGAYVLKRFTRFQISLERVADVLRLIFFAAIASTLVSATIGVTSLLLGGLVAGEGYGETWIAWWIGDMLGALIVTPLLLVWHERLRRPLDPRRFASAAVPILLLAAVSIVIFRGLPGRDIRPLTFAYIIFPILIWIALRFGQRGSVTAMFIVSCIAIWETVTTHNYSSALTLSQNLLLLQSFIGITAATFMTMAAVVSEREQTQKRQQYLEQKAALLTKQRSRLEMLNRAKDEFISIASHQLRTPATGVKQYLGMLLQDYAGRLSKQQHAHVTTAYENNERQLKIIEDLLHVARIDAGKLPLNKTTCDLNKLMGEVAAQQAEAFKERGQKLLFSPAKGSIKARADKELLRMVLENLIDNAGKYSPAGEKVRLSVSKMDRMVRLEIHDKGFGITKKDQKKLFQKFSRVDAHSNLIGGSGLGLYWAKKVIDLHGGSIDLTSEAGEGSTFTVKLPDSR
ncbi:MAG TPA: MASE1 domain-containing protein [Candidatus Limnocylindria bacterium]|nr:MASE1 domain-containing protein [Candidatus Limnocylindria bacterium]